MSSLKASVQPPIRGCCLTADLSLGHSTLGCCDVFLSLSLSVIPMRWKTKSGIRLVLGEEGG